MIPLPVIFPEVVLIVASCALFLVGVVNSSIARKTAPILALLALVFVFAYQLFGNAVPATDPTGTFIGGELPQYIKLISAGVGAMFVLLSWPTNPRGTANSALSFGNESGEYFGLLLLSITGIFVVAGANDIILLFLGVELASIPTYVMVSVSRPLPVAQEAGVKYFFLGAMSAALMLFGFSYLYGTTGATNMTEIAQRFAATVHYQVDSPLSNHASLIFTPWQMLAAVMVIVGLAFKMAAVPLHFYAGDVYQGAATPVTALLSYVPKTSGFIALIKVLYALGGGAYALPPELVKLLWILAVLTMSVGNVLGLVQLNVKRVLAYSSVAHSGYMLAGVTAMVSGQRGDSAVGQSALAGVLFYLAAYGIMNAGSFGVLMLLPARPSRRFGEAVITPDDDLPPASAETYEDIAGAGRRNVALGLAMAVSCFSLIGLPLTVGFFAKFFLIGPVLMSHNYWLAIVVLINAVIGAVYYLKIVGTMFLRPEPAAPKAGADPAGFASAGSSSAGSSSSGSSAGGSTAALPFLQSFPAAAAVVLSTAATLAFGILLPMTQQLRTLSVGASTPTMLAPAVNGAQAQASPVSPVPVSRLN
jgi:NADH-quinone oxidoreductase subunit N